MTIVRTVLLAVRRIEGESGIRPSDGRMIFIQPRLAEDDIVSDGGNIQADQFFISSGFEDDGVKLGDVAPVGAVTICKD